MFKKYKLRKLLFLFSLCGNLFQQINAAEKAASSLLKQGLMFGGAAVLGKLALSNEYGLGAAYRKTVYNPLRLEDVKYRTIVTNLATLDMNDIITYSADNVFAFFVDEGNESGGLKGEDLIKFFENHQSDINRNILNIFVMLIEALDDEKRIEENKKSSSSKLVFNENYIKAIISIQKSLKNMGSEFIKSTASSTGVIAPSDYKNKTEKFLDKDIAYIIIAKAIDLTKSIKDKPSKKKEFIQALGIKRAESKETKKQLRDLLQKESFTPAPGSSSSKKATPGKNTGKNSNDEEVEELIFQ